MRQVALAAGGRLGAEQIGQEVGVGRLLLGGGFEAAVQHRGGLGQPELLQVGAGLFERDHRGTSTSAGRRPRWRASAAGPRRSAPGPPAPPGVGVRPPSAGRPTGPGAVKRWPGRVARGCTASRSVARPELDRARHRPGPGRSARQRPAAPRTRPAPTGRTRPARPAASSRRNGTSRSLPAAPGGAAARRASRSAGRSCVVPCIRVVGTPLDPGPRLLVQVGQVGEAGAGQKLPRTYLIPLSTRPLVCGRYGRHEPEARSPPAGEVQEALVPDRLAGLVRDRAPPPWRCRTGSRFGSPPERLEGPEVAAG